MSTISKSPSIFTDPLLLMVNFVAAIVLILGGKGKYCAEVGKPVIPLRHNTN